MDEANDAPPPYHYDVCNGCHELLGAALSTCPGRFPTFAHKSMCWSISCVLSIDHGSPMPCFPIGRTVQDQTINRPWVDANTALPILRRHNFANAPGERYASVRLCCPALGCLRSSG